MDQSLLFVEFFCTSALVGLIWTIQLVHYPTFHFVEKKTFKSFMQFHTRAISFLVIPLMLLELGLCLFRLCRLPELPTYLEAACLLLIWLSTFLLSVPCHDRLIHSGFNQEVIQRLISTNWPRTILWSLKGLMMILA